MQVFGIWLEVEVGGEAPSVRLSINGEVGDVERDERKVWVVGDSVGLSRRAGRKARSPGSRDGWIGNKRCRVKDPAARQHQPHHIPKTPRLGLQCDKFRVRLTTRPRHHGQYGRGVPQHHLGLFGLPLPFNRVFMLFYTTLRTSHYPT